jgi:uncharacterized membrane protein required for colicin V production
MTWLNTAAIAAIIVVVVVEGWRRFGKALFDAVGAILAVKVAHAAQPGLASMVSFSADADANQAWAFVVVFVVVVAMAVVASTYLQKVTLLALPDAFEGFAGGVLGLVSGVVLAHALAWAMFTSGGGEVKENPYAQTFAVRELVDWDSYHQALYQLKHLGE